MTVQGYTCAVCGRRFFFERVFRRHIAEAHPPSSGTVARDMLDDHDIDEFADKVFEPAGIEPKFFEED